MLHSASVRGQLTTVSDFRGVGSRHQAERLGGVWIHHSITYSLLLSMRKRRPGGRFPTRSSVPCMPVCRSSPVGVRHMKLCPRGCVLSTNDARVGTRWRHEIERKRERAMERALPACPPARAGGRHTPMANAENENTLWKLVLTDYLAHRLENICFIYDTVVCNK